jgi:hypothetical protein
MDIFYIGNLSRAWRKSSIMSSAFSRPTLSRKMPSPILRLHLRQISRIHQTDVDTEPGQVHPKQFLGPGIAHFGSHDVITGMLIFPIAAVPLGGIFVAVLGLIADLTDYDQLKFGQRREAIYYGIYGIVRKTGWALCSLILAGGFFRLRLQRGESARGESRLAGLCAVLSGRTSGVHPLQTGRYPRGDPSYSRCKFSRLPKQPPV